MTSQLHTIQACQELAAQLEAVVPKEHKVIAERIQLKLRNLARAQVTDHAKAAQRLLATIEEDAGLTIEEGMLRAAQAQVHATLATADPGAIKREYRYGYRDADGKVHFNIGAGYRSLEEAQYDNDRKGGLGVVRRLYTTGATDWERI